MAKEIRIKKEKLKNFNKADKACMVVITLLLVFLTLYKINFFFVFLVIIIFTFIEGNYYIEVKEKTK